MDERLLIDRWTAQLDLDNWWKELIGQNIDNPENFSVEAARETIPWSEFTTSQEIHRKFGHNLTYIEASKTWYAWDGRIHAPCDGEALAYKVSKIYFCAIRRALSEVEALIQSRKHALELAQASEEDVKKLADAYSKGLKRQRDYRDRIASDAGLTALVRMMRSDFSVPRDHYDNDQQFLVLKNCVLDLSAMRGDIGNPESGGKVVPLPHDPSRPVTKYLDASYNHKINYGESDWWRFLTSSVKDSDPDTLKHIQKVIGAAFMGQRKLRTILNFMGPPSSGKSVLVETLWKLGREGSGYCAMPDSRAITKVQGQNFEQDDFRGRRFIAISEPSSREDIDDDFLKRFTGDENMKTRTLNVQSSDWTPQGILCVSSNATLKINFRDEAIVDRVQVIEFPYKFRDTPSPTNPMEKQRDRSLPDKLSTEDCKSAILNWIIVGMQYYVKDDMSLEPPASVEKNKKSMVSRASSALRWVNELLDDGDLIYEADRQANSHLKVDEAYSRYTLWSAVNGERRPLTKLYFEEDIGHQFEVTKYNGNKVFKGLGFSNQFISKLDGSDSMRFKPSVPAGSISDIDF